MEENVMLTVPPFGKNWAIKAASERPPGWSDNEGMVVLIKVPGERPLRWRVP